MGSGPFRTDAPRHFIHRPFVPQNIPQGSPAALLKHQMAHRFWFFMSSGSKKEELRCACLIEAKASHRQRMWTEVSSSAPHFLHSGLSTNPIKWGCLHRVLYPVRSPVTTLDFSLLKDKYLALVPRSSPDINSPQLEWQSCHLYAPAALFP
jgi:hypothetical protein